MLFYFLLVNTSLADSGEKVLNGYDPKVDIISEDYEAGPFLIYDCVQQHWTCVLESYYKDCEKKRVSDLHFKKEYLRCAPVAELPNKKSCFQKQLFLVSQNFGQRFCIGPAWQQKEIKF
jgi:hypothetical protein